MDIICFQCYIFQLEGSLYFIQWFSWFCLFLFQVMSLCQASLSLLIKAAPILTNNMYGDIQPTAWEILLSVDKHMAAGESAISHTWVDSVVRCDCLSLLMFRL